MYGSITFAKKKKIKKNGNVYYFINLFIMLISCVLHELCIMGVITMNAGTYDNDTILHTHFHFNF